MNDKPSQAFVFFARDLTPATYKIAKKIQQQLATTARFYVLSYREDKELNGFEETFKDCFFIVDRQTLEHECNQYTAKYNNSDSWRIMPGNLDLAQITLTKLIPRADFYWFCEDDVRFGGDFAKLINSYTTNTADLLCTNVRPVPAHWFFLKTYKNDAMPNPEVLGFLPFFRINTAGLQALETAYKEGCGGHHEISWPNILISKNLSVADFNNEKNNVYTSDLTRMSLGWGSFCYFPPKLYYRKNSGLLYHPVKPFKPYVVLYKKYIQRLVTKLTSK